MADSPVLKTESNGIIDITCILENRELKLCLMYRWYK